MILINFKLYSQTFGSKGEELINIIKDISQKHSFPVVVTASNIEAYHLLSKTGFNIWLQHVDNFTEGRGTGFISPLQAQRIGINGSLLNHSEHRLPKGTVQNTIKNRPEGFKIVCCAHRLGQIPWIAKSKPDFILYEPPHLIASPNSSISTADPSSIKSAVTLSGSVPLMVGAGIKNGEDVKIALKMGAKAIGLASAFVNSPSPAQLLEELVTSFKVV